MQYIHTPEAFLDHRSFMVILTTFNSLGHRQAAGTGRQRVVGRPGAGAGAEARVVVEAEVEPA